MNELEIGLLLLGIIALFVAVYYLQIGSCSRTKGYASINDQITI